MAAFQPAQEIIIEARNDIGAEPGDWVRLEMESRHVLTAAFMIYVFPLIAAVLGYFAGALLASQMGISGTAAGGLGAALFFVMSYAGIRAYDRKAEAEGKFRPTIVEVLKRDQ